MLHHQGAILLLLTTTVTSVHATVFNYNTAGSGDWFDPTTGWSPSTSTLPTLDDELWMNTANTELTIDGTSLNNNVSNNDVAGVDKLIVGRHALNTKLNIVNGASLWVGSGNGDVLFVGQYDDAEGSVTISDASHVTVLGELAVAVSGKGNWVQSSGSTVTVRDRFVIGRYQTSSAVGNVVLKSGAKLTADNFDMNAHSTLRLEGGLLELTGDHVSKVQGHLDGGRISGSCGVPKLEYNEDIDMTLVWCASVFNYNGDDAGEWSNPSIWPAFTIPAYYDEVWMNVPSKSLSIPSGFTANIDKLVIGRHVTNTHLTINGVLNVNDILFVGQYEAADGTVNLESGRVAVQGELAVSVSGKGTWIQNGGSVYVRDRFVIGRYFGKSEAVGMVVLRGGSIVADRFDMNPSVFHFEGGILALNADHVGKLQGHIDGGRIVGTGDLKLVYDREAQRTYLYAQTGTTYTNYFGQDASSTTRRSMLRKKSRSLSTATSPPSWFEPSLWQPNGVPGPASEVWMNSPNTVAVIGENEVATANKLIVGRHVGLVTLMVNEGAELLVGDKDSTSSILFLGQYSNSHGTLIQKGGSIRIHGEFAVGVSGPGSLEALGGRLDVFGRLILGRYDSGTGSILLNGGEIHAERLDINGNNVVDLQVGRIFIDGDNTSKMSSYVNEGNLVSHGTSQVLVQYDSSLQQTILEGTATPNPTDMTTPEPTRNPTPSPSKHPTSAPVSSQPTANPTNPPTKYISPEDWDVRGILQFDAAKIGPKLPVINRNSLNTRQFTQVPEAGVHPRIFFGPEDIPRVRASIENTSVGQAAYGAAKQVIALLVYGRNSCGGSCYNDIPNEEKNLPNGKQKISNAGLYHSKGIYDDLIAGSCSMVESVSGTHTNVLGGGMAVEAWDLLIFPDQADANVRKTNLASAMSNWAECVLNNPAFTADGAHGQSATRDLFGGQHLAYAYDLAFNFMSTEQQGKVRKAIAAMIWLPEQFYGIGIEPYATTSNWVTINSFVPAMIMAIEGETEYSIEGWSTSQLEEYFDQIMMAEYKFLTYGFYEEGAGYEGSGKNYQYNAMMPAYAKRGYNFFTHPHTQSYGAKFLPNLLQPFGHSITSYDTIGGSGLDPEWGGQRYHPMDIIGLKWGYPDDAAIDFMYRQFIETPYKDSDGSKQVFIDVFEQKITPRSTYANAFLALLIMPSDYASDDFETMSSSVQELTFYGKERGLVISKSGFKESALSMNFHVRQDMGGHTYGDRLSFTLSGLGRVWVRNPVGYVPETEWSSGILVDGEGITIAPQDGRKARMPGRLVTFQDNALSTFTMGDATYAYNTAWKWCRCRPIGSDIGIGGWDPVLETWNDFRSPSNQITETYGDVPFVDYASWVTPGYTEGIHKQTVNDLSQAYRQAGLIRGEYPYSIIVDDFHKLSNGSETEWQFLAQLPEDLSMVPPTDYSDPNLDPARDVVFQEPLSTGNRKLLVRILNAEGSQPEGLAEFKEFAGNLSGGLTAWRLIIRRVAERPRFRIMMYPYEDGQPIPRYSIAGNGAITLTWSSNLKDKIQFHQSTQTVGGIDVELTGIEITRSGNVKVVDTRNEVATPMDIRS